MLHLLTFHHILIDVQPSLFQILDQFRFFDGTYKFRPVHGIDVILRQRNRRITDVVNHLQCGDECVILQCPSEQAKFDGVVVIEIDCNVSAVAAAFGFLQDLLAGFFKAESCTPAAHVVAASAAERKEFIPMLFYKEQDSTDNIFLFCLIVPKSISIDVNVQTAS